MDFRRFHDPAESALRELVELLLGYAVIWGSALGVGWLLAAGLTIAGVVGGPLWQFVVGGLAAYSVGLLIFVSFDGERGAIRKAEFDLRIHRYAFPLAILCGLAAGWLLRDHHLSQQPEQLEELGWQDRMVASGLSACVITPGCTGTAFQIMSGTYTPDLSLEDLSQTRLSEETKR